MQTTINFIKYHAVEFSKFTGYFIVALSLVAGSFVAGMATYNYLFPIIGVWVYLPLGLVLLLALYIMLVPTTANKQIET